MTNYFLTVQQFGSKIYHSYKFQDKYGRFHTEYDSEYFCPSLFLNPSEYSYLEFETSFPTHIPYESLTGEATLSELKFRNNKEMNEFLNESLIPHSKIYGDKNLVRQFIANRYSDLDSHKIDFSKIRKYYFDIEVVSGFYENGKLVEYGFPEASEAKFPICSIALYDSIEDKYHLWTLCNWTLEESIHKNNLKIEGKVYENEESLLKDFGKFLISNRPDVFVGHNSKEFDIPYLVNRYTNVFGEKVAKKVFSPFGIINIKNKRNSKGNEYQWFDIFGLADLDFMELVRKYYLEEPLESVALEYLGTKFLKEGKLKYEGSINEFYYNESQKYADYNIKDVLILKRLDDKLGFVNLHMSLSYLTKSTFQDAISPVRIWESAIFNKSLSKNIATPLTRRGVQYDEPLPGAYVYPTKPQILKTLVSFDFESLYPSVIKMLNIASDTLLSEEEHYKHYENIIKILEENNEGGLKKYFQNDIPIQDYYEENMKLPICLVEYLQENNLCMSASLNLFHKNKNSVSVDLVAEYFKERKSDKKEYQRLKKEGKNKEAEIYYLLQHSKKILLNCLFGTMANDFFKYSNMKLAKSITLTGQLCIKSAMKAINKYLSKIIDKETNFVVAGDTDSSYFELNQLLTKFLSNGDLEKRISFLDKTCQRIESQCLEPLYDRVSNELNAREKTIRMKREVICAGHGPQQACGLFSAVKHYYLLVDDSEGFRYQEPNEKIMGLHSKTRLCPAVLKPYFNSALKTLVTEGIDSFRKEIENFKENVFKNFSIDEIARPYSVSHVERFVDPNTNLPWKGQWYDRVLGKTRTGGVPLQSKSSCYYNFIIKELGLENKYQSIKDGDRIKILFLKPNKYGFETIAIKSDIPEEFLNVFEIDWDMLMKKTFIDPIEDILKACTGKELEIRGDLDSWFD